MMDMFKLVVDSILCYVEELVLDFFIKGLKNIILVGGFLDCKIIQKVMREKFKDFRVVILQEVGLVVLQGVVLFGENLFIVLERVSFFIYGIWQFCYFLDGDFLEYRMEIDGIFFCKNVFNVFVRSGQIF